MQAVTGRFRAVGGAFKAKYVLAKAEVERESRIAATLSPDSCSESARSKTDDIIRVGGVSVNVAKFCDASRAAPN